MQTFKTILSVHTCRYNTIQYNTIQQKQIHNKFIIITYQLSNVLTTCSKNVTLLVTLLMTKASMSFHNKSDTTYQFYHLNVNAQIYSQTVEPSASWQPVHHKSITVVTHCNHATTKQSETNCMLSHVLSQRQQGASFWRVVSWAIYKL